LTLRIYQRFQRYIHEFGRFATVGAVGFVATAAGYNVLRYAGDVGPLTANTIATTGAAAITFLGNRYWTFAGRARSGDGGPSRISVRETILFLFFNAVGLGIQAVCIGVTNYALGHTDKLSNNIALLAGICLGTVFRFWSYRTWVWCGQSASADSGTADGTAHVARAVPAAGAARATGSAATTGTADGTAGTPGTDGQAQARPAGTRLARMTDGRPAPVYVSGGRFAEDAGPQ
jgi:putative flippase GtrA